MPNTVEKIIAVLSLVLLCFCLSAGILKDQEARDVQIKIIVPEAKNIVHISDGLYSLEKGKNGQKENMYLSFAEASGYAGPMQVAILVDRLGKIQTLALVKSPDTKPYLDSILKAKMPETFLNTHIQDPRTPDTISGATISSNAIIHAVQKASANLTNHEQIISKEKAFHLNEEELLRQNIICLNQGYMEKDKSKLSLSMTEIVKIGLVFAFFALALFISSKKYTLNKKKSRLALLVLSVLLLGFLYSTQFSLATLALLFSGTWLYGLASYAPLICLILAFSTFFMTKKNLYCTYICPFGALQEGMSLITSCSTPKIHPVYTWISRFFALGILCFALYFMSPSSASYEPFGKTFNMVGTLTLFILSGSIILISLFIQRPWCRLLCPMTPIFDYVQFWRKWLGSMLGLSFTAKNTQKKEDIS